MGGYSASSDIVSIGSSSSVPLAIGLSQITRQVIWANQYTLSSSSTYYKQLVSTVEVRETGLKAIIVFDYNNTNGPLTFAYISTTDGSIIFSSQELKYPDYQIKGGGQNILIDSTDSIYFAYQGYQSKWSFLALQYSSSGININYQFQYNYTGIIYQQVTSDYQEIYVGGTVVDPATNITYSNLLRMNSNGTVEAAYAYREAPLSTNYFYVRRMYQDSAHNYLHMCFEASYSTSYLQTVLFSTSTNTVIKNMKLQQSLNIKTCYAASGISSMSYFYISFSNGSSYMLKVDYTLSKYQLSSLDVVSISGNIMAQALIINQTTMYYVGYLKQLADPTLSQTYSYRTAYVLPFDSDSSCLNFTYKVLTTSFATNASMHFFSWLSDNTTITSVNFNLTTVGIIQSAPLLNSVSLSNSWCNYQKFITAPLIPTETYELMDPALYFTVPSYTCSIDCSDISYSYSSNRLSYTSMPTAIQFFNNQTYVVETSSGSDNFVYKIQYNATINDGSSASTTFSVNITSPCQGQTLTIPSTTTSIFTYDVDDDMQSYVFPDFIVSAGTCSSITYSLSITASSTGVIDNSIYTFSPTSPLNFTIYTNKSSAVSIYTFILRGNLDMSTITQLKTITVTIKASCKTTVLTWSCTYTSFYYDILNAAAVKLIPATPVCWTQTLTYCPAIQYQWIDSATNLSAPSIFFINTTGAYVNTNDPSYVNTYNLFYQAYVGTVVANASITVVIINCNFTDQIIPSVVANQDYTVGSTSVTTTIQGWSSTLSYSQCGPITYTSLSCLSISSVSLTGIALKNASNPWYTLYNANILFAGVYNCTLSAQIGLMQITKTSSFNITLIDPCPYSHIVTTPFAYANSTITYYLRNTASSFIIAPVLTNNVSFALCQFGQYLQYSSITAYDPTIFSFVYTASVVNYIFTISSSTYTKAGTYSFIWSVYSNSYPSLTQSINFQVVVIDNCTTAYLTGFSNKTINYSFPDTETDTILSTFTTSATGCGTINYSLLQQSGASVDSSLFLFSSTTMILSINNTDSTKNGSYALQLIGTLPSPYSNITTTSYIDVYTNLSCILTTVLTSNISNMTYTIGDSIQNQFITAWSETVGKCGPIIYTAHQTSGTSLPSFIKFNSTCLKFSIFSSLTTHAGTYYIALKGLTTTAGIYAYSYFNVTVVDPCPSALISHADISDPSIYQIRNVTQVIDIGNFSSSVSSTICGDFQYSITSNYSAFDSSSPFTFTTTDMEFKIYSDNVTAVNVYIINITVYQGNYSANSIKKGFALQIVDRCSGALITAPMVSSTQIYYLKNSTQILSIGNFSSTVSDQFCGDFTEIITQNGSSLTNSPFSLNTSSMELSIYTTNTTFINTFVISIIAYQGYYPLNNQTLSFNIQIIDPCPTSLITAPSIPSPIVYYIKNSTLNITIGDFLSIEDDSKCGDFVYQSYSNGSTLNSSIFTLNQTTMILSVYTINPLYTNYWDISIIGYQSLYPSNNKTINFTVITIDPCPTSLITTQSVSSPIVYYIKNSTLNISVGQFLSIEDASKCGDFVYSSYSNGLTLNSSIFTLNQTSMILFVQTNNSLYVGSWSICVIGYQSLYPTNNKTITFTVTIIDPCPTSQITAQTITQPTVYYIKNTTLNISIGHFVSSEDDSKCADFVYQAYSNGLTLNSSIFTLDDSSMILSIYTANPSYADSWIISILGYQSLYPANNKTITFTIIIIDPCPTAYIISPTVTSSIITYYIMNTTLILNIGQFIFQESSLKCGSYNYVSTQNNSTLSGSPFTLNTTSMVLSTYASSGPYYSIYTINVTVWQGIYSSNSQTISFQIEIIDICRNAIITPSSITNTTYKMLRDSQMILSFNDFSINTSFCGPFTYTVTLEDLSSIDTSFITFNSSNRSLAINSTDLSKVGEYVFLIVGSLISPYSSSNFSFALDINCYNEEIIIPILASISYAITQNEIDATIPSFIQFPACNYPFQYSMTLYDGSPLPSFINYNSSIQQLSIVTSDNSNNGTYKIKIQGQLVGDPNANKKYSSFKVTANASLYHTGQLPYYKSALVDQTVEVGKALTYSLPLAIDPNPGCSLTASASGLPSYITFSQGIIKCKPSLNSQAGIYPISLALKETDACPYQMSSNYQITITITAKPETQTSNTTTTTPITTITEVSTPITASSSTSQSNDITVDDVDSSSYSTYDGQSTTKSTSKKKSSTQQTIVVKYSIEKKNVSNTLQAYISSIGLSGLTKIMFTENVMVPTDFQTINSSFLSVDYIKRDAEANNTLQSWTISDFQPSYFTIQLNFTDPYLVSQSDQKDSLKVIFVSNGCFRTAADNLPITYLYSVEKDIPSQSPYTSSSAGSGSASSSMKAASQLILSSNVAVQFLLYYYFITQYLLQRSASLNQLWGMINAMQILTVLPAFTLFFPSNAQEVLSLFLSIAQFQVIDTTSLFGKIFKPKLSQSQDVPSNLMSIGMNSTNMFMNLGIFLVAIFIIIVAVILTFILERLARRNKICNIIHSKVRPLIFYTFILRPLIEGYLNFCLSTMLASEGLFFDKAGDIIESIFVIFFMVFITGFPPMSYYFLRKFSMKLKEKAFKQKFESLYEGIKTGQEQDSGIFLNPFFLFRRFVLAVTIIFITNFTAMQLCIQTIVSLYYLQFLIHYQPFEVKKMNYMEMFNEMTLLISFYMCYNFTDFVPDPLYRYFLGKIFIGFIIFNLGVNVMGILGTVYNTIKRFAMKKCKDRKNKNRVQVIRRTTSMPFHQSIDLTKMVGQFAQTTKKPINRIAQSREDNRTEINTNIGNYTEYSMGNQSLDNMSPDYDYSQDLRAEDVDNGARQNLFLQPTFVNKDNEERLFKNIFSIQGSQ